MNSNKKTTVLSSSDVQAIVQSYGLNNIMDKLINVLEREILAYDAKETVIPKRSGFNYEKPYSGLVEWMPVYSKEKEVVIKVVGYHPQNPIHFDLPTILSTISNYDTSTGHLNGVVDGVLLTALRTGAASAIASKYMAAPESSVLGLIGCGAQAVTQLHAISRIFDINKVVYFDIDKNTSANFKNRCALLTQDMDIEFVNAEIPEILRVSDILCTATSIDVAKGPLFSSNLPVNPELHINAVGSDFPGKIELPLALLKESFVCPDFKEQAQIEGECQQLESEDIGPELEALVKAPESYGSVKEQLSVFDSTGWALEDSVVMNLFMEVADELGIGTELVIENILTDAKNPYQFLVEKIEEPIKH